MQPDLIYYRRRQAEETAAAAAALDSKVRDIHRELARKYDERLKQLEPLSVRLAHLVSAA